MSDFYQKDVITTFHKLGRDSLASLERKLKVFAKSRPIALILPSLYREDASGALPAIKGHLRRVHYLQEIILCLDRSSRREFKPLGSLYLWTARDTLVRYESDARIEGLSFDRHAESSAVEAFAEGLRTATCR